MKRWIMLTLLLEALLVLLVGRSTAQLITGGGTSGGGGGAPSGPAGGDLGGSYPNPIVVGSSNFQQPVMFIGSGTIGLISAATTTGTINSPPGVANGDLELVFIGLNNATSSAFTPPAGWTAVASCASQGNTATIEVFSHTASSEGGTIAAFTWTTNGTGMVWASAYRNAAIDVCAASNAATATTFTTSGITAVTVNDRIVAVGTQAGNAGGRMKPTTAITGAVVDASNSPLNGNAAQLEVSFPITSTTVSGYGFTNASTGVWAGAMIGLSYSASTTSGPPGNLTYNEQGSAYLGSLVLNNGLAVGGSKYALTIPSNSAAVVGGLGLFDGDGALHNGFSNNGNAIHIGDALANNSAGNTITIHSTLQIGADTGFTAAPRMFATFPIAAVAATTTTQWGEKKIAKAITIDNVVFNIGAFTCSVNPAFSLFDCSNTVGTCTPVSTLATSGTLTAIGSTNAATTPTATVAAGEFIAAEFTAGTCTVLNGSVDMEYKMQ